MLCVLIVAAGRADADDGVFYAQGNTLFPVRETSIVLKKERLLLRRDRDYLNVSVAFEFFNPGPAKDVVVGFVTPPASGDVDERRTAHPQITNFSVVMNAKVLRWNVFRADGSGFRLGESVAAGDDFIYHFKARFVPGVNTIRHTYCFLAGGNAMNAYRDFSYRLTTGKMWAGGSMEDFELTLDMGGNEPFLIPRTFQSDGKAIDWQIVGRGRLQTVDAADPSFDETGIVAAFVRPGGLIRFRASNFRPDFDLSIVYPFADLMINAWSADTSVRARLEPFRYFFSGRAEHDDRSQYEDFSTEQLQLVRNILYARHGVVFTTKSWAEFFAKIYWYMPEPGVTIAGAPYTRDERLILRMVAEELRRRR